MTRAGLERPAQAERTIDVVLESLGERLAPAEVETIATVLPDELASALRRKGHTTDFDRDELYARVALREDVELGFAVEHVQVVCQILAEIIPDPALIHLRAQLPEPLAELFTPRPRYAPPPAPVHPSHAEPVGPDTSLSGGRPASYYPVSEANPDRAQMSSVARDDNPHGDSKLSSTHGLAQERRDETLATGKPGSKRPLSEG